MSADTAVYFSGGELVRAAIQVEKNGLAFYTAMARRTRDTVARQTFVDLAEQERRHRIVFENMLKRAGDWPPDPMTEDYQEYLKALMRNFVFTTEKTAAAKAARIEDTRDVLDIGIQSEKDSIIFYQEIRGLARRTDRRMVTTIANEERSHLARLSAMARRSQR